MCHSVQNYIAHIIHLWFMEFHSIQQRVSHIIHLFCDGIARHSTIRNRYHISCVDGVSRHSTACNPVVFCFVDGVSQHSTVCSLYRTSGSLTEYHNIQRYVAHIIYPFCWRKALHSTAYSQCHISFVDGVSHHSKVCSPYTSVLMTEYFTIQQCAADFILLFLIRNITAFSPYHTSVLLTEYHSIQQRTTHIVLLFCCLNTAFNRM